MKKAVVFKENASIFTLIFWFGHFTSIFGQKGLLFVKVSDKYPRTTVIFYMGFGQISQNFGQLSQNFGQDWENFGQKSKIFGQISFKCISAYNLYQFYSSASRQACCER